MKEKKDKKEQVRAGGQGELFLVRQIGKDPG